MNTTNICDGCEKLGVEKSHKCDGTFLFMPFCHNSGKLVNDTLLIECEKVRLWHLQNRD